MTQLLILKRSYKEGQGHPYYTSGDVPAGRPYPGKMDMIDTHDAHNPFKGIFKLEILAKLAKLPFGREWPRTSLLHVRDIPTRRPADFLSL